MHILAYVCLADKKLGAQVVLGDDLMVGECDGTNSCEDEVLRDFIGQSLDGD